MELISRKNFMIFLAALLVVALGYMALSLTKRQTQTGINEEEEINQIESQSQSDDLNSIEIDLNNTDYSGIDKDLQNLDTELKQSY